jgi:hypothetical protein
MGDSYPSGVGMISKKGILGRSTIAENLLKKFHGKVGDGGEFLGATH